MSADALINLIKEFSSKGEITDDERDLLKAKAKELDLTEKELQLLIEDVQKEQYQSDTKEEHHKQPSTQSTTTTHTNSAYLTIHRSSEWQNRWRGYKIYLDDEKLGTIKSGSTKEFQISPGYHTLKIKIIWMSSKTIEFHSAEGEDISFVTHGPNSWILMVIACVLAALFKNFITILLAVLVFVYFFIYKRYSYLTLKQSQ